MKSVKPPYSRERRSGGLTPLSLPYTVDYSPPPPGSSSGTLATGGYAGWWKVMRDIATPGYSAARKRGDWVNHPMNLTYLETSPCYSSTVSSNTPSGGQTVTRTWSGDALGYVIGPLITNEWANLDKTKYPDLVSIDNLVRKATIDCLNRIASPSSQSLVTVLEMPKTVEHLASTLARFVDARRKVMKLDIPGLKRLFGKPPRNYTKYPKRIVLWDETGSPTTKFNGKPKYKWHSVPLTDHRLSAMDEAAKTWMEYRYGWGPLVYDIVDTMKALDTDFLNYSRERRRVSQDAFKATASESSSRVTSNTFNRSSFGGGSYTWRLDITHKVVAKAYAFYSFDTSGLSSRFNDFGAFDVPRAIWEIVPASFIVDWFVPFGDWLGAMTPRVGVNILASGVVTTAEKTAVRTLTGYTPDGVGPGQWPNSPVALQTFDRVYERQKSRVIGLSAPLTPPVEVNLNLNRFVDAVAILKGLR